MVAWLAVILAPVVSRWAVLAAVAAETEALAWGLAQGAIVVRVRGAKAAAADAEEFGRGSAGAVRGCVLWYSGWAHGRSGGWRDSVAGRCEWVRRWTG